MVQQRRNWERWPPTKTLFPVPNNSPPIKGQFSNRNGHLSTSFTGPRTFLHPVTTDSQGCHVAAFELVSLPRISGTNMATWGWKLQKQRHHNNDECRHTHTLTWPFPCEPGLGGCHWSCSFEDNPWRFDYWHRLLQAGCRSGHPNIGVNAFKGHQSTHPSKRKSPTGLSSFLIYQSSLTVIIQSLWLSIFENIAHMDDADAKRTGRDNQGVPVSFGWTLSSEIWEPTTSYWMRQSTWLRTALCGGWCHMYGAMHS